MKNFWIIIGIIVFVGLLYFGGKALLEPTSDEDFGPMDDGFDQISTTIPETTTAPAVVATGSPVTSPVPSELPLASPSASGAT